MADENDLVERLVEAFRRLPGVGRRSAERYANWVLSGPEAEVMALARALREVKQRARHCQECFSLSAEETCAVCRDARRDRATILVVETATDQLAFERMGEYRGLYHVLLGRLAPLDDVGPEQLTVGPLLERVRRGRAEGWLKEVILATNPTVEGDTTACYVAERLAPLGVLVSRVACGLPSGSEIEHAQRGTLAAAWRGRRSAGPARKSPPAAPDDQRPSASEHSGDQ